MDSPYRIGDNPVSKVFWATVIEKDKQGKPLVAEAIATCVHMFTMKHDFPPNVVQLRKELDILYPDLTITGIPVGSVMLRVEWIPEGKGLSPGQVRVYRSNHGN